MPRQQGTAKSRRAMKVSPEEIESEDNDEHVSEAKLAENTRRTKRSKSVVRQGEKAKKELKSGNAMKPSPRKSDAEDNPTDDEDVFEAESKKKKRQRKRGKRDVNQGEQAKKVLKSPKATKRSARKSEAEHNPTDDEDISEEESVEEKTQTKRFKRDVNEGEKREKEAKAGEVMKASSEESESEESESENNCTDDEDFSDVEAVEKKTQPKRYMGVVKQGEKAKKKPNSPKAIKTSHKKSDAEDNPTEDEEGSEAESVATKTETKRLKGVKKQREKAKKEPNSTSQTTARKKQRRRAKLCEVAKEKLSKKTDGQEKKYPLLLYDDDSKDDELKLSVKSIRKRGSVVLEGIFQREELDLLKTRALLCFTHEEVEEFLCIARILGLL